MIEKKFLDGNKAKLVIGEIDASLLNGIRRTLITDIPKLAIDEVIFYENTSPLTNEILASRLALLPIPTEQDLFVPREECTCNGAGCPNCTLIFTLSKEGPCTVYSRDLEPQRPEFCIVDRDIPIVKLLSGQRLIFEATAILGTAKKHAKYQAAFAVGYKNYPAISIDLNKCDLGKTCIEVCPIKIIKKEGNRIIVTDIEKCTLCKECEKHCEFGALKVDYDKNKFIFRYETDGAMDAKSVLVKALGTLDKKYEEFKGLIAEQTMQQA